MREMEVGIQRERLLVLRARIREPRLFAIEQAELLMRDGMSRAQGECSLQARGAFREAARAGVR